MNIPIRREILSRGALELVITMLWESCQITWGPTKFWSTREKSKNKTLTLDSQIPLEYRNYKVVVSSKTTSTYQTPTTTSLFRSKQTTLIVRIRLRRLVRLRSYWGWTHTDVSALHFDDLNNFGFVYREVWRLLCTSRLQGWLCVTISIKWWSLWSNPRWSA